jgi:hypothetical protein
MTWPPIFTLNAVAGTIRGTRYLRVADHTPGAQRRVIPSLLPRPITFMFGRISLPRESCSQRGKTDFLSHRTPGYPLSTAIESKVAQSLC